MEKSMENHHRTTQKFPIETIEHLWNHWQPNLGHFLHFSSTTTSKISKKFFEKARETLAFPEIGKGQQAQLARRDDGNSRDDPCQRLTSVSSWLSTNAVVAIAIGPLAISGAACQLTIRCRPRLVSRKLHPVSGKSGSILHIVCVC